MTAKRHRPCIFPRSEQTRFVLQLYPQPYPTQDLTCIHCSGHGAHPKVRCAKCANTGKLRIVIDPQTKLPVDSARRTFWEMLPPMHQNAKCSTPGE